MRVILPVVLGAALGYTYYALIGCSTGACPITSNPWISTAYGALLGALLVPGRRARPETEEDESNDHPALR